MAIDLILGTAGHIDHGKSSLVRALTGTDPDRLPEEKQRGITIDLGFAHLALGQYHLGIVDVPGHERFVRNMLAGATGIDVALLVVAADEAVKQQTREHLDILKLLDIPTGVVALTKCDVPTAEWMDLVEEEVRELVAGSFLAEAPIVRTSATSGHGLAALKDALAQAAAIAAVARAPRLAAPFRLPIDRTFTIAGHGTVVTGSVASGRARVGDELLLEPGGQKVRLRGLQNHDEPVEEIHAGQRAALNLAGVHHSEIVRGQELGTPGHLTAARLMTVELTLLDDVPTKLKHRTRVRLHLGTGEYMASVLLLSDDALVAGGTALAQLLLSQPAVATWNQPLVLRSESPVRTIGGGRVLDPAASRIRRRHPRELEQAAALGSDDPLVRTGAALYFAGLRQWTSEEISRSAGHVDVAAVLKALEDAGDLRRLPISPTRELTVHRLALEELFERVEQLLAHEHDRFPLRTMLDRSRLVHRLDYLGSTHVIDAVLDAMQQAGRLRASPRGIALPGRGPQLSANEQKLIDQIIEQYRAAGFQPPSVEEVLAGVTRNQQSVPQLLALAEAEGRLVRVSDEFYLHAEADQQMRSMLNERMQQGQGLTVSEIRELLGTSRKYAVPICEYLDQSGFTRREGDMRFLNQAPSEVKAL